MFGNSKSIQFMANGSTSSLGRQTGNGPSGRELHSSSRGKMKREKKGEDRIQFLSPVHINAWGCRGHSYSNQARGSNSPNSRPHNVPLLHEVHGGHGALLSNGCSFPVFRVFRHSGELLRGVACYTGVYRGILLHTQCGEVAGRLCLTG